MVYTAYPENENGLVDGPPAAESSEPKLIAKIMIPEPPRNEVIGEARMEAEAKVKSKGWRWNGRTVDEVPGLAKWSIQLNTPKEKGERFDETRVKSMVRGVLRGFIGERESGVLGLDRAITVCTTVPMEELAEHRIVDLASLPGGPSKERILMEASLESVSHLLEKIPNEQLKLMFLGESVNFRLANSLFERVKRRVRDYHTGAFGKQWRSKPQHVGKPVPPLDSLVEHELEEIERTSLEATGRISAEARACRFLWEVVQGESDSGRDSTDAPRKILITQDKDTLAKIDPLALTKIGQEDLAILGTEVYEVARSGINYETSTIPDALVDMEGFVEVKALKPDEIVELERVLEGGVSFGGVLDGVVYNPETKGVMFVGANLEGNTYFVDTIRSHLEGYQPLHEDQLVILRFPADAPDEVLIRLAERVVQAGYKRLVVQKLVHTSKELNDMARQYIRDNLDKIRTGDYKGMKLSEDELRIFEELAEEEW